MADLSFLDNNLLTKTEFALEGERGFLDKVSEAFGRGREDMLADVAVSDALMNPDTEDLEGAVIAQKKLRNKEIVDPIEGRYIMNLMYKSAGAAGALFEISKRAVIGGVIEGAAGAGIGSVVPGLGTAVGASTGWGVGTFVGGASFMYRQGVGAMYTDMIDMGVDADTARKAAFIGAFPYAVVGTLPLKTLGGPFKRIVTGKVQPAIEEAALSAVRKGINTYVKGLGGVIGGDELQTIATIATEKAAKSYQDGGIDIDQDFIMDTTQQLVDTFKQSIEGGLLLPVPGAVAEGLVHKALYRINRDVSDVVAKSDAINTIRPSDVSDPQMKFAYGIVEKINKFMGADEVADQEAYNRHVVRAQEAGKQPDNFISFQLRRKSTAVWKEQEAKRSVERQERLGKKAGDIRKTVDPRQYVEKINTMLKEEGAYAHLGIEPLQDIIPIEAFDALTSEIVSNKSLRNLEARNLADAIRGVYYDGRILQPAEIKLARKALNPNLVSALESLSDLNKEGKLKALKDINDLFKSAESSMDISRLLRQEKFTVGKPTIWAKGAAMSGRILAMNENEFALWDKSYRTDVVVQEGQKHGLIMQDAGGGYARGSEFYPSKLLSNVPGMDRTERAFVGGGNAFRGERWRDIYNSVKGHATDKDLDMLAHIINITSGVGDAKALGQYAPYLNCAFFSPKTFFGNVQSFTELFHPGKLGRMAWQYLAWNWVKFLSINAGVLASLSYVPGVKVERDYRSTDFGKIQIGNTHIDFWGGYLPMARSLMRLWTQERKTAGGEIVEADAKDTITRFLQQKLGPVPSTFLDMWRGETSVGESRDIRNVDDMSQEIYTKLTPLFIQDLFSAFRYQGVSTTTATVGALSFLGATTSTYPMTKSTEASLRRNSLAQEAFGAKWNDLGPDGQKYLREKFPEIEEMDRQVRFERDTGHFMQTIEKNLLKSQKKIRQSLPQDVRDELDGLGITLQGVNRRISSNWYLNDARYNEYEAGVLAGYKDVLPKVIRSPQWGKLTPAHKAWLIKKYTEAIRGEKRQQIIVRANTEDFQRIQYGVK